MNKQEAREYVSRHPRAIVEISSGRVFPNIKQASEALRLNYHHVRRSVLSAGQISVGKHTFDFVTRHFKVRW